MKQKLLSLSLALTLALTLLCPSAFADLPKGFWSPLQELQQAQESGNEEEILAKGDAYLAFLAKYERNQEIAENQYNVYLDRLDRAVFEKRSDWDRAVENTQALLEVSQYLQSIGVDRLDMIRRCETHLSVLPPVTGVYAASYAQSNTYGSKIAPASGAFYGSIAEGCYGDGSICSFYVELEYENAGQFDYLIGPKADGKRVILINLNFKGEGATANAVPSGAYDGNIRATLNYLATLQSPVLLRIGAEMDVWTSAVSPEAFRAAYNHIAALARSLAPKVELVWSPNFISPWGVDVNEFYPGESTVDWVGVSLYYNKNANGADNSITWIEHTRAQQFADPITVAEKVFSIAKAHNKPAIATEGGLTQADGADYMARQAAKEFSTLTMVYPQVKAIVYFDKVMNGEDFRLTGAARDAADAAIAANPTLVRPGESAAATYVPLESFNEKINGTSLLLAATGRTYHSVDVSARWVLDGTQIAAANGSPNQCTLLLSALGEGTHQLEVTLDDGQGWTTTKSYKLTNHFGTVWALSSEDKTDTQERTTQPAPDSKAGQAAGDYFSTDIVAIVNGKPIDSINAGGKTLINVEALAHHGFTVTWDGASRMLSVFRGGADRDGSGASGASGAVGEKLGNYYYTDIVTSLDGRVIDGFNTGGQTWICAEDMERFGYSVVWNGEARTLTVTEK